MRALAASLAVALAASVQAADAPPPASASKPEAAAARPQATREVILRDGTRIPCIDAPLVAMGRVLYRTADGARHALPIDKVDLEKTRPEDGAAPGALAPKPPPATERRVAPDFTAKRKDGTSVKLSELRGKVVLVDFWATWCGPCVQEMPHVKKVYEAHSKEGFEIVGVSLDFEKDKLDAYLKTMAMPWPQHFDGRGWGNAVAQQYGVSSIPTTLLLDRKGRIAKVGLRGPLLEKAVKEALTE